MSDKIIYIHFDLNGHKKMFATRDSIETCRERILRIKEIFSANGYSVNPVYDAVLKAINEGSYEIVDLSVSKTRGRKGNKTFNVNKTII